MSPRDRAKPAARVLGTELCVVRRLHAKEIGPGTILARYGAWQRKYSVEYVTYVGQELTQYESWVHVWHVGVRNLGEFYADGRVYRPRTSKIKEIIHTMPVNAVDGVMDTSKCYGGLFGGYGGGYHPVEPVNPPDKLALIPFKPVRSPPYKNPALTCQGGTYHSTLTPAPLPPEAVLDMFRIKKEN